MLREAGEIDVAAELQASARKVDRLMALGRAWMYETQESMESSPTDNGEVLGLVFR